MPRGPKPHLYNVHLACTCEWAGCNEVISDTLLLKDHQIEHFKLLYNLMLRGEVASNCGICDAMLDVNDWGAWERHSHYHAWSQHLRARGLYWQQLRNWPPCLATTATPNAVPDLPTPFECGWQYCSYRTNDIAAFMAHIVIHPQEYTDSRYPSDVALKCQWDGCSYVSRQLKNLVIHMDTHAQAKRVACPTCGLLLVNRFKLEHHLKRQQVHLFNKSETQPSEIIVHPSVKPERCPHCRRLFATEELLRNHVKRHVNRVKCPFCIMTCQDKAALDRHIIFCHSNERPFACDLCGFRFKLASDLRRHTDKVHAKPDPASALTYTFDNQSINADLDADFDSNPPPLVLGPLAAAGAVLKRNLTTNLFPSHRSNRNPSASLLPLRNARGIRCSQPGCRFVTAKWKGFWTHLYRRHGISASDRRSFNIVAKNSNPSSATEDSSQLPPVRRYACHLCNELKRTGRALSKHLIRQHQVERPFGLSRFQYTLSEDGHYRLQLTRLNSVEVLGQIPAASSS